MNEPPRAAPDLWGLVLAGGRSRRFAAGDKAGARLDGETLLERTVGIAGKVVGRVFVSARADQHTDPLRSRWDLITDDKEGQGPAGGLLSAHRCYPDVAWLAVACDLPLLDAATLGRLTAARDPGRAATAFRSPRNGQPEPLCAIYEPATLSRFRQDVERGGSLSPTGLLANADVVLVDITSPDVLTNVNTVDDRNRALQND